MLVLHAGARDIPDLPSAFTGDLLDAAGRTDSRSSEWPAVRALVNLFMRGPTALVSYLCGDGGARVFDELGAVFNWADDTDGDGVEDRLQQDL